jgi:hypothetical protein
MGFMEEMNSMIDGALLLLLAMVDDVFSSYNAYPLFNFYHNVPVSCATT